MKLRLTTALLFAPLIMGCTGMADKEVEQATPSTLATCPSSPNCVCSTDTGRPHHIAALVVGDDPDAAWQSLLAVLDADNSINITDSADGYIKAEAKTRLLRFTDDLEFLLNREAGVIDMRSASRVGYSDLGKNRKRLEGLRQALHSRME